MKAVCETYFRDRGVDRLCMKRVSDIGVFDRLCMKRVSGIGVNDGLCLKRVSGIGVLIGCL